MVTYFRGAHQRVGGDDTEDTGKEPPKLRNLSAMVLHASVPQGAAPRPYTACMPEG